MTNQKTGASLPIVQLLGPASDWKEKQDELYLWTGSAFLAGETDSSDAQTKAELYSWLCGLGGWLATVEETCALLAKPEGGDTHGLD